MQLPPWLEQILNNSAVWGAALNLINTLLFFFIPTFPKEIWIALSAFINAILAAVGIVLIRQRMQAERQAMPSQQRVRDAPADASTLGPLAASTRVGGNVTNSDVVTAGRDADVRSRKDARKSG
jgi:hypothetical protein